LTWEGHEFLDAARNKTMWNRAKTALTTQGAGLSFDVMKALLLGYVKQELGLPT
jgi:hypothetical protein